MFTNTRPGHDNSRACKVYKIQNLPPLSATLVEPAACAVHGLDTLRRTLAVSSSATPSGLEILLLGSGPTGLLLAQLLRQNGAVRIVVAAHAGPKLDAARRLNVADEYVALERGWGADAEAWRTLKESNPYGFDVVVSTTLLPE